MPFTAIKGIRPWLESLKAWRDLDLGAPPNQLFVWGQAAIPLVTQAAAPLADSSNKVELLSERLPASCNGWIATNRLGQLERSTDAQGLGWTGRPYIGPFCQVASVP